MSVNVMICAYRDWAIDVYAFLANNEIFRDHFTFQLIQSQEQLLQLPSSETDNSIMICIGWSWKIPRELTNKIRVYGVHPSDLPNFAGGSPIQHQVLSGIHKTKLTLFRFNDEIDSGPIVLKIDLSLTGGIQEIFMSLKESSITLLSAFLVLYPAHREIVQEAEAPTRKRIRPKESELSVSQLGTFTARELYDFIRCREDPYPNAYIRDATGCLFFKKVRFEENS